MSSSLLFGKFLPRACILRHLSANSRGVPRSPIGVALISFHEGRWTASPLLCAVPPSLPLHRHTHTQYELPLSPPISAEPSSSPFPRCRLGSNTVSSGGRSSSAVEQGTKETPLGKSNRKLSPASSKWFLPHRLPFSVHVRLLFTSLLSLLVRVSDAPVLVAAARVPLERTSHLFTRGRSAAPGRRGHRYIASQACHCATLGAVDDGQDAASRHSVPLGKSRRMSSAP